MTTMKKFIYLLIALPFLLASCSNDDDLPEVDFSIQYSGAQSVDGILYVVQGDTLKIDAINITPREGTKPATIGATAYYWDYLYFGTAMTPPFAMALETADLPAGNDLLQFESSVFQVDKSVATAYFTYKVKIVESADDIPSGSVVEPGVLKPDPDVRSGAGAKFN